MVELDIVDDYEFREVVQEFGALVEEGRVVFVPFQHGKVGIREAAAAAQVAGDAADHEAGVHSGILHQPREHGGRGGFAVRSGHHVVALAAQEVFLHRFRQGKVAQAALKHGFHFLVAAAHGVADDDDVRFRRNVGGPVAFKQRDAFLFQKGGHGGVHVGVGPGDGVAPARHGGGYGPHGSAADAQKVEMLVHVR